MAVCESDFTFFIPHRRFSSWVVWAGAVIMAVGLVSCTPTPPQTRWTMVNVTPGQVQADCHLLEFPNGERVLIDVADAIDAPGTALTFLEKRKIKHIDLVIISHFHKDHYGRLLDAIKAGIKIDRVAISLPASREQMDREHQGTPLADWDDVMATLKFLREKNIPYFIPNAGDRLIDASTRGVPIYLDVICRYDGVHTPIGKTDINDTSIIVRLTHGNIHALFTGDLNRPLGEYLARSNLDLSADILKAPHHGTEGCAPNEFFDRVHPTAVLVPSPRSLWFSLRSKRIRDYFSSRHIPAYIAGINGNVVVTITAQCYTVWSEHPSP